MGCKNYGPLQSCTHSYIATEVIQLPHSRQQACFINVEVWLVTLTDENALATVLGSPVGKPDYIADFVSQKVKQWVGEIEKLAEIADSQPHAAYGAITHGLSSKWSYLSRTTPDINHLLVPIEASIRTTLLPKLTGHNVPNDVERRLFSLPAHLGGLNITDPSSFANEQFNASQQVTKPLVDLILSENQSYPYEVLAEQIDVKSTIKSRRCHLGLVAAQVIRESLTPPLQLAMDLAQEKGASSWLTALSLEEHGFTLQIRFPRCHGPEVRLDSNKHSISLCMWSTLLSTACSLLSERRVSFNQA